MMCSQISHIKYLSSQMTIANLFNYVLFFLNAPFFNLSHFKNILFLSQCGIGNFDSPGNMAHFSLNEKIPPHLRNSRVTTSVETRRVYLRSITTCTSCSCTLPQASANGHCQIQVNLIRWMLDGFSVFPGKGL